MEITQITEALQRDAVWVVFLNVLLQQLGLPVPAVPTLLLAGSLAAGTGQFPAILAAAVAASVIADWAWYLAGRRFGYRVLAGLCKLSINPSSCVTQTEARFIRWGLASLVVAKFVPGFSTVAPPIAGSLRMRLPGFLFAAAIGALLWAGVALIAGWLLRHQVSAAIVALDAHMGSAASLFGLIFATWLGWKLWQKHRFRRLANLPHIEAAELRDALLSATPPRILDLRDPAMIADLGAIPGAITADLRNLEKALTDWPKSHPVVTLCACPEDASARQAAQRLLAAGYLSARPLRGGFEQWQAVHLE